MTTTIYLFAYSTVRLRLRLLPTVQGGRRRDSGAAVASVDAVQVRSCGLGPRGVSECKVAWELMMKKKKEKKVKQKE